MEDRGITPELIEEILKNVCLLLDIKAPVLPENPTPEQQEKYDKEKAEYDYQIEVFTYYIKAICMHILIKTNRRMFPTDLKYLVVNLVKDEYDSNNPNSNIGIQQIQSMSEYDRTISFSSSNSLQTKLNLIAQQQVEENSQLINKFKLLYKT